jgi:hypothetical protein
VALAGALMAFALLPAQPSLAGDAAPGAAADNIETVVHSSSTYA